jgi:hypothetical protein
MTVKQDWRVVTKMAQGKELRVTRVELDENSVAIEGNFELPPLAKLDMEEQVFVASFIKSHGSIKEMERLFGVSYPTIKARLSKIGDKLTFIDVEQLPVKRTVIDKLSEGEITLSQALSALEENP